MKRFGLLVILVVLVMPCLAVGQAQTPPPPKPGPEVQRLGYFVGTWNYEGEFLLDPKGKYGGTYTFEWFPGGLSVVVKGEGTGVRGPMNELHIWGYDATTKAYTWYVVHRGGANPYVATWSLNGNAWTYERDATFEGKPTKRRYTVTEVSPTSFAYKVERSIDGGPWTQTTYLNATKVK
jgi:hypothetical protein